MTKAEIVETVVLQLSGGRLSADIDVRREDVYVLVDAAINNVMREYSRTKLQEYQGRLRTFGAPGLDQALEFAVTHSISPVIDKDRNLYYLPVPGRVYRSGGRNGLHSVMPIQGKAVYKDAQSESYVRGLPDMGITFFWLEEIETEDRVYLKTISTPICQHLLTYTTKPSDAEDDEELGLPDGLDLNVIERLKQLYREQYPQDVQITDTDETRMVKNER